METMVAEERGREGIEELKSQCQQQWTDIHMLHHNVENNVAAETSENGTNPMVRVFQAKEQRLQAEIDVIKQKPLNILPSDTVVLKTVLAEDIQTSVSQLQETLSNVQAHKKELRDDLKRAQDQLQEHIEVQEAIRSKLDDETTVNSTLQTLRRKQKKLEKYLSDLDQSVFDFLTKHFPAPTADVVHQQRRRRSSSGNRTMDQFTSGKKFSSLHSLVQKLVKAQLERPHDPYIPIQDKYWPPYIELLLRCGIILHKGEDSNYIKLTPFHL